MSKLLDFMLCAGITLSEVIVIIIAAMLIQLIVYRTTGISLYNTIIKLMFLFLFYFYSILLFIYT